MWKENRGSASQVPEFSVVYVSLWTVPSVLNNFYRQSHVMEGSKNGDRLRFSFSIPDRA